MTGHPRQPLDQLSAPAPPTIGAEAANGACGTGRGARTVGSEGLCGIVCVACLLAWIWSVLFARPAAGLPGSAAGANAVPALHALGMAAAFLAVALKPAAARRLACSRWPVVAAAAVLALGVAPVIVQGHLDPAAAAVAPQAWLPLGAACALGFWGVVLLLSGQSLRAAAGILAAGGSLAAALCLAMTLAAGAVPRLAALPLLAIALALLPKEVPAPVREEACPQGAGTAWIPLFFRRNRAFALGLPLYGVAFGFVCAIGNGAYAHTAGPLSAFAAMLLPCGLLLALPLFRKAFGYSLLQGIACCTAVAFLPLLFLGSQGTDLPRLLLHVVLLACLNGFAALSLPLQVQAARAAGLKAAPACALGQALHNAGLLAGWLLGTAAYTAGGLDSMPLHAATAVLVAALIGCVAALGGRAGMPLDGEERKQLLAEKRRRIAAERGLSKREQELFDLMACGCDRQAIQDRLFISKNTVKTHTRNIYAKLGVHSADELRSLVDRW